MEHIEVRRKTALADARASDGMAALGLRWWEARRPVGGILPHFAETLPLPLSMLVATAYLVDVVRQSPTRFGFSLRGHVGAMCPDITCLMVFSPRLREVRPSLNDDLGFVAFSGTPSYQAIELRQQAAETQRYRRLILPLTRSGVTVDQLFCLVELSDIAGADADDHAAASRRGSVTG